MTICDVAWLIAAIIIVWLVVELILYLKKRQEYAELKDVLGIIDDEDDEEEEVD